MKSKLHACNKILLPNSFFKDIFQDRNFTLVANKKITRSALYSDSKGIFSYYLKFFSMGNNEKANLSNEN